MKTLLAALAPEYKAAALIVAHVWAERLDERDDTAVWIVNAYSSYGIYWYYRGPSEFAHAWTFESQAAAERFAMKVMDAARPIDLDYWRHERTEYASEAYVDRDVEMQVMEVEARMDGRPGYSYDPGAARDLFKCL